MTAAVLCTVLAASAVGLLVRPATVAPLAAADRARPGTQPARRDQLAGLLGSRALAAVLGGLGVALVVDGVVGVLLAPVVGVVAYRVIGRLEPAAVRRRRMRIAADLPLAVDLLTVCLGAGRPVGASASVVAAAVGGPLGAELARVGARVELGGDPLATWSGLARDPALGPLARAVVRALDTGAPLAESLGHLVDDLRRERRAAGDELARQVAVRSAGPLGLCFLPAFVLVGIVPTVIGAFRTLLP